MTDDDEIDFAVQDRLRADLARDYRLVWAYRHPDKADLSIDRVWERRPGR